MNIDNTTVIDAPAAQVWATISDVEHWSDWTASVTSVRRLDQGPLRIGSRQSAPCEGCDAEGTPQRPQ